MNTPEDCKWLTERFCQLEPSLRAHVEQGNFRIVLDDQGAFCVQWTNTAIFPVHGGLAHTIAFEMFEGQYAMQSTLIGIEMKFRPKLKTP